MNSWMMRRLGLVISLLVISVSLIFTSSAQEQSTTGTDAPGEPLTHTIQYGDTLYHIALQYGVTMEDLAAANDLSVWSWLVIGQTLVIPGLTVPDNSTEVVNPLIAGTPTKHTVQPGETLSSIAQKYGISMTDLMKANNIANPDIIYRGQELTVWTVESVNAPIVAEEAGNAPELNLPADQPNTLATPLPSQETPSTNTTTATNGNQTDFILDTQPDPVVDFDVRTTPAAQAKHIVQPGETLGRIAAKYGVTSADIVTANNITNPDQIYAGQELFIPAVINGQVFTTISANDIPQGPKEIPKPEITTGKFVLVDLSDSMVYAYQDGVLVYTALGSMGLPATPTVQGHYTVYSRYDAQIMSGPGYYLPNVQWIQYFYKGYALHGAYWHNNWGQPMSHGCVNLRNEDALWLYNFGEIGMPVHVQA